MPFTSLATRLAGLPLILAGPILRRTEKDAVTVWMALKQDSPVRLTIQRQSDGAVMFGADVPGLLRIGPNLFVGAITARTTDTDKFLSPAVLYQYEMEFQTAQGTRGLASENVFSAAGGFAGFSYGSMRLPTFALPPSDIELVRLIHGSCRKPHGEGHDALVMLDDMIAKEPNLPLVRPHALFLTGDQIYADDVADALLGMICDASAVLIATKEQLPMPLPVHLEDLSMRSAAALGDVPPGARAPIALAAGMTAGAGDPKTCKSHLMTMGEFILMHLFAWSDSLWSTDLPSYKDARTVDPDPEERDSYWEVFAAETKLLTAFRNGLPRVRRALANIPSYMTFDDHEVTDDWNLHYSWCNGVLGGRVEASAGGVQIANHGRQIVTNGMAAYALCQAWGNAPATFDSGNGKGLLQACAAWTATPSAAALSSLQDYLVPPKEQPFNGRAIAPPSKPVSWHYNVRFAAFEVLALDSRTQRTFPGGGKDAGELISRTALASQVSITSGQADYLVVVCPAPVLGVTRVEWFQEKRARFGRQGAAIADMEPWAGAIAARERLFAQLALNAPARGERRQQRVLLLSGDVHYAFVRRMRYWASSPYDSGLSDAADLLVVQATSSSLRNQTTFHSADLKSTIEMQGGVTSGPLVPSTGLAFRAYGYTNANGTKNVFARRTVSGHGHTAESIIEASGSPVVLPVLDGWTYDQFDWRYRVDNIGDARGILEIWSEVATTPTVSKPLDRELQRLQHSLVYSKLGAGRALVGYNNIAEIRLGPSEIVQTLYWRVPSIRDDKVGLGPDAPSFAATRFSAPAQFTQDW